MASERDVNAKGVKGVAVILRTENQMLESQNIMVLSRHRKGFRHGPERDGFGNRVVKSRSQDG